MSAFVLSLHAQAIPGCCVALSVITVFTFTLMIRQFTQGHLPGETLWDMEVRAHLAQAGKDSGRVLIVSSLSSHQRGLGYLKWSPVMGLVSRCIATVRVGSVDIMSASYEGPESNHSLVLFIS